MIGGLAIVCFVKAFGSVFLGTPRTNQAAQCHESDRRMIGVMIVLAIGCMAIGLAPALVIAPIDQAVHAWMGSAGSEIPDLSDLVPTTFISMMGFALVILGAFGILILQRAVAARSPRLGTWECGYALPSGTAPRIQYTASSFAQFLVGLFRWALWPKHHLPQVIGRFPKPSRFKSHVPDAVLDRAVLPTFRIAAIFLPWLRLLQQGKVQVYVLYILTILIVLLLWG